MFLTLPVKTLQRGPKLQSPISRYLDLRVILALRFVPEPPLESILLHSGPAATPGEVPARSTVSGDQGIGGDLLQPRILRIELELPQRTHPDPESLTSRLLSRLASRDQFPHRLILRFAGQRGAGSEDLLPGHRLVPSPYAAQEVQTTALAEGVGLPFLFRPYPNRQHGRRGTGRKSLKRNLLGGRARIDGVDEVVLEPVLLPLGIRHRIDRDRGTVLVVDTDEDLAAARVEHADEARAIVFGSSSAFAALNSVVWSSRRPNRSRLNRHLRSAPPRDRGGTRPWARVQSPRPLPW